MAGPYDLGGQSAEDFLYEGRARPPTQPPPPPYRPEKAPWMERYGTAAGAGAVGGAAMAAPAALFGPVGWGGVGLSALGGAIGGVAEEAVRDIWPEANPLVAPAVGAVSSLGAAGIPRAAMAGLRALPHTYQAVRGAGWPAAAYMLGGGSLAAVAPYASSLAHSITAQAIAAAGISATPFYHGVRQVLTSPAARYIAAGAPGGVAANEAFDWVNRGVNNLLYPPAQPVAEAPVPPRMPTPTPQGRTGARLEVEPLR